MTIRHTDPHLHEPQLLSFVGYDRHLWCVACAAWVAKSCPHYAVCHTSVQNFCFERQITPPPGVFCVQHDSWDCQAGQGRCSA